MISVIIPTLNEEKLVGSVLGQFTKAIRGEFELEIIVSDGGSMDQTRNIAAMHNVRIVCHEAKHRQTIAAGRNLGAHVSKGDLLLFVNSDTRFDDVRKFFLEVHRTMDNPKFLAATCAVHVFPEEERGIDRSFHAVHNTYCRFLNFIGEGMGRGECQIIRRKIFETVGGYNASMPAGEDYDLFRRVRRLGKIAFLKNTILYESPRRFRKYGYAHIVWGWTKNALSVAVKKKSSSEEWEAVR